MNRITLIGRLGQDVELKTFPDGGMIGNTSIATSYRYKKNEEWVEGTDWHNLVFNGKRAEAVEKYTSKGSRLYVEGRMTSRSWEAEDGTKRYRSEVRVTDFTFLDSKSDTGTANEHAPQANEKPLPQEKEDDLPF